MNNTARYLSLVLAFCAASFVSAAEGMSRNEQQLEQTSSDLDKDGAAPQGRTAVEASLKSGFTVDDERVQGLREQKLGYGEISIVLGLAQKMPGGITDANVQSILTQRQGPPVMGWGQIAKKQGVKLVSLLNKVKKVSASVRKQEKAARADKLQRTERGERPERNEKPEPSKP